MLRNLLSRSSPSPKPAAGDAAGYSSTGTETVTEKAATLARQGRFAESLALIADALEGAPHDCNLHYARGLTLFDSGRYREARDELLFAESALDTFGLHLNLAHVSLLLGLRDDAEARLRRALVIDSSAPVAYVGLGNVLQAARRYAEAIDAFRHALSLSPERTDCLLHIAACLLDAKNGVEAERWVRRALQEPGCDGAKASDFLATALTLQDRWDEALSTFEQAEAYDGEAGYRAEVFVNYGFALLGMGQVARAIELYRRHLPRCPRPIAHAHYAFALLTQGNYRDGFRQYEFRWFQDPLLAARPRYGRPRWTGQDLSGRTLLVSAEQGIGDFVQFARFIPLLARMAASVVVHVPSALREFARDFRGIDRVIVTPAEIGDAFDFHVPVMSIPNALGGGLDDIPREVPYLRTDATRLAWWRDLMSGESRLKVGLVWAGNRKHDRDRYRSMKLSVLAPILQTRGVAFYSLQRDTQIEDDLEPLRDGRITDLATELGDFRDTATAIEALDLVITVDTAVAHVAGALGKPVWLLLPAAGDFRWMLDCEGTPWYPTMRLFRQLTLGDWRPVVEAVAIELDKASTLRQQGADCVLVPRQHGDMASCSMRPAASSHVTSVVVETRHGIVQLSGRDDDAERALEHYGEWLEAQLSCIASLVPRTCTIVEMDAGIGAHTLPLAGWVESAGHILAFEEDLLLRRMLGENLRANKYAFAVTIMRGRDTGGSPRESFDTIDQLRLVKLGLIKVNRAGTAARVLESAEATLWTLRPRLHLAVGDDRELGVVADIAKRFGYRCWRTETSRFSADNFNRRSDNIFGCTGELALVGIAEECDPCAAIATSREI